MGCSRLCISWRCRTAPWLIAGTGGGARAAVVAAREHGVAVAVTSRDVRPTGSEFEDWISGRGCGAGPGCGVPGADQLDAARPPGRRSAADRPRLGHLERRSRSTWCTPQARPPGSGPCGPRVRRAADGRAMLVAQGAAAFECWFPEQARTGGSDAGGGQCSPSLADRSVVSAHALAGVERWLLPPALPALRRADLRSAKATRSSATLCRLRWRPMPAPGLPTAAASRHFEDSSAASAPAGRRAWPSAQRGLAGGLRPRRGTPAQVRGMEPGGGSHGRSHASGSSH